MFIVRLFGYIFNAPMKHKTIESAAIHHTRVGIIKLYFGFLIGLKLRF